MFEINKENLEQANAEHMARKMLAKMMSDAILNSETASEEMKLSVLIMEKASDIHESIHNLVDEHVIPGHRSNAETLKTVLEYLSMVEVGIKQFMETTSFVAEEETEEEE
jgi:hypothetical protein